MSPLFPIAFPFLFAGMWVGVSYLLSRMSGWRALSQRYPAVAEPVGERLIWASAQLGGVSFRSCLNMTLSPAGLYMVPARMFRLFMPPLLIPWSDVRFAGFPKVFFFEFACLRLGGAEGTVLCLFRRGSKNFLPFLSDQDRRDYDSERRFDIIGLIVAILTSRR